MIHSHAKCDFEQCGKFVFPEGEGESVDETYLADLGWVCVKWTEGDEEDRVDEARDFCSFICAARWCAEQIEVPVAPQEQDEQPES